MSLRAKLISGFLLLAVLTGGVGWFSYSVIIFLDEAIDLGQKQTVPTIIALQNMESASLRVLSSTVELLFIEGEERYAISDEEDDVGDESATDGEADLITKGRADFDNSFKRYEYLVEQYFPDEKEFVEEIQLKWMKFGNLSDEIIDLRGSGVVGQDILEKKEELEESEQELLGVITLALENEFGEFEERRESVEARISNSLKSIITVSVSVFLISILLSLFLSYAISRPVVALKRAAKKIGSGDLGSRVEVKNGGEFGELAQVFNDMAEGLAETTISAANLEKILGQKTMELSEKVKELEKMNNFMVGRELKMVELKNKIKRLKEKSGKD